MSPLVLQMQSLPAISTLPSWFAVEAAVEEAQHYSIRLANCIRQDIQCMNAASAQKVSSKHCLANHKCTFLWVRHGERREMVVYIFKGQERYLIQIGKHSGVGAPSTNRRRFGYADVCRTMRAQRRSTIDSWKEKKRVCWAFDVESWPRAQLQ